VAVKNTPKINVTKLMDMGMGDAAEVTPKRGRGRPKKLQTLAEVQADINLKEFKKAQKKLDAAKLMNKNAKGTEKILMQSNMILADIAKIISTDLAVEQEKEKEEIDKLREEQNKGKVSKDEKSVESSGKKVASGLKKTSMKALQPVANMFDNLKNLAATLGIGILGNAAFEFIRNPENSEKIAKFFGFIQKNAKFILAGMGILAALPLISTLGGVIGAIKIAFSGLAFVMANPVILGAIALIGAPIGLAIGAGKLAEFIERKVEGGSAFVDAQDQLDQQLKDAGMDSKGRIGYTNKRGRFIKKGDRNAEQEALFQKVQAKRKELRQLRDDMRKEMDAQKATVQMSGVRTTGRDKGQKYFSKEDNEKKAELEASVRADFEAKIGDIVARKRGGRGARGRTILVGEQGPELFTPNTDGQITNSNETLAMLADGANQVNIITEDLPPITTPMPAVPVKEGVTANAAEPVSSINPLNDYMIFTPQLLGIE
tara:strand:+ start:4431 stop:5891 length:1461 start_codon:yes stop_codon:yes gene_type:complete